MNLGNESNGSMGKVCVNCVLPENFPGISFNQDGICNFCQAYTSKDQKKNKKNEYSNKFDALIEKHRGKSSYDALYLLITGFYLNKQ
jgi:uncharacterized Fe-S cluster-containing MiaB family protein